MKFEMADTDDIKELVDLRREYLSENYGEISQSKLSMITEKLPACIFLLSGILLRHRLLAGFAVLFTVGHIYVTRENIKQSR